MTMSIDEFNKSYNRVERKAKRFNWFGKRANDEKQLRASVVEKYKNLMQTKGDLFEMTVQPIGAEEIQTIKSRKQKALRRIYFITTPVVALTIFLISREPAETRLQNPMEIFEMLIVATLVGGWWYFTNRNFNRILNSREKQVIKGVLTDKVNSRDYHKYELGDCLQIEILSEDIWINRKIVKTGNI
jgi:hypothetical protein